MKIYIALILMALLVACSEQDPAALKIQGGTMGTQWHITLSVPKEIDVTQLQEEIQAQLDHLNQQFSTYLPDSTISRFNQHKSTTAFPVSKEFLTIIKAAQAISKKTEGAFDITIAPLINLWGFGAEFKVDVPADKDIQAVKGQVGYEKLSILEDSSSLQKANPDLIIDLSAIAKGYAVDQVAMILEAHGVYDYLVEIGGEIKLKGKNPHGENWRVGIQQPDASKAQVSISLNQTAMATSGDYHNYFESNGQRYSHTLDPVTGKPITHKLASVTVLHESTMIADALATALSVMGSEKGMEFAEQHQIRAYMITRQNKGFVTSQSTHFQSQSVESR